MKKIINNILHRLKEDSLVRRQDKTLREKEYKELKDIKKCLVFWVTDPEERKWLKEVSAIFKGARIDRLCFVPAGVEILETDDTVVMRNEDLGFGGKIQNEKLLKILEKKYDLLIDLTPVSSVLGNYVLHNTQTMCIAGMKKENSEADLVIDGVNGPMDFIEKLANILSQIKKY